MRVVGRRLGRGRIAEEEGWFICEMMVSRRSLGGVPKRSLTVDKGGFALAGVVVGLLKPLSGVTALS